MEVDDTLTPLPTAPPSTPIIKGETEGEGNCIPPSQWLILSPNLPKLIARYQRYFHTEAEVFLHDDIVHIISSFATGCTLAKMATVSKSWNSISSKSCYWSNALHTDFGMRIEELRYKPDHPRKLYEQLIKVRIEMFRQNKIDPATVQSIRQNGISSNTYRYLLFGSNAHYFTNRSSSSTISAFA